MKQKILKIRIVGAEDETILEREGINLDAVLGAVQLLDENTYLEVSVKDVEINVQLNPNAR